MRAQEVGDHERVGVGDRAIHVRLGSEVHHRVAALNGLAHGRGVLDRASQEGEARIVVHLGEVLLAAGVRELVEHHDLVALVAQPRAHERRADEARPAADEQPHDDAPAGARSAR